MVFDGASNALGNGIGAVIISPKGCHTPFINMAEYEARIMGFKAAIDLRIKFLSVFGDSALVISQIKGPKSHLVQRAGADITSTL